MSYLSGGAPIPTKRQFHHMPMGQKTRDDIYQVWFGYSACDSEVYPFDKDVVRAIRRIDPNFVPLVVRKVFAFPSGGHAIYENHVLAHVDPNPKTASHANRLKVLWPTNPNSVNYGFAGRGWVLWDDEIKGPKIPWHPDLPYQFEALSWKHLPLIEASHREWKHRVDAMKEAAQIAEHNAMLQAKAEQKGDEEVAYRVEHDAKYTQRALESLSGPEIEQMGRFRPYESKPFVH